MANNISGNMAENFGGGLCLCEAEIADNTIQGNSCEWCGGGLSHCSGRIVGNAIIANVAQIEGGGLDRCRGPLLNNKIIANQAAVGAGLYGSGDPVYNNLIAGNWAVYDGGGAATQGSAFHNNTVVRNGAERIGGGISGGGRVLNCMIWGNTAVESAEQVSSTSGFSHCLIQDWHWGGDGNMAGDPRFVDADGPDDDPETWEDNDYRLLPDSPCIDAGINEDWMWEATDLAGSARVCQALRSLTVDMGAYEYFRSSITKVTRTAEGGVELTWTSRPGDEYTVWSCFDPTNGTWEKVADVRAEEPWTSWLGPSGGERTRFFRIGSTE